VTDVIASTVRCCAGTRVDAKPTHEHRNALPPRRSLLKTLSASASEHYKKSFSHSTQPLKLRPKIGTRIRAISMDSGGVIAERGTTGAGQSVRLHSPDRCRQERRSALPLSVNAMVFKCESDDQRAGEAPKNLLRHANLSTSLETSIDLAARSVPPCCTASC